MSWKAPLACLALLLAAVSSACTSSEPDQVACANLVKSGFRPVAEAREDRFLGKVQPDTALCRGGERAVALRDTPWLDWPNYWATGDQASKAGGRAPLTFLGEHLEEDGRGVDGALLDLEYQRIELIKFNLFDNATFEDYLRGRDGVGGRALKVWPEMRLGPEHPAYAAIGGEGEQLCRGRLIRHAHAERHLQRHPQPGDGLERPAVRPQRPVRGDLPRAQRRLVGQEPARRPASRCCGPIPR